MKTLRLDVWSDIACPWCYIGKRHLEQALATFEHAKDVQIVWRAFELDTTAPKLTDKTRSHAQRIADKYGIAVPEAQKRIDHMTAVAAKDGLDFRFDISQSGNTFDAHRLLHWALEGKNGQHKQGELKERLMRAYLTEGQLMSDRDTLVRLAREVGLDEKAAREVLETGKFTDEVRADEALARELGITGVPFFVMAGRLGVSGAQPQEVLAGALKQAWEEHAVDVPVPEGASCGPDGC